MITSAPKAPVRTDESSRPTTAVPYSHLLPELRILEMMRRNCGMLRCLSLCTLGSAIR
jgi:hypothetical protein